MSKIRKTFPALLWRTHHSGLIVMLHFALLLYAIVLAEIQVKPPPARNASSIRLKVSVEPSSGLPAIPPTLRVTAHNRGFLPAELRTWVRLYVDPVETVMPFYARSADGDRGGARLPLPANDEVIVLAPNESRTFVLWASPTAPEWFVFDRRLWEPGQYDIRVVIEQPHVESPSVTYRVVRSQGADRAIWSKIREFPDDDWSRLADLIWREHPESLYARYVTPSGRNEEEWMHNLRLQIEKAPNQLLADRYRSTLAGEEAELCHRLRKSGNLEGAIEAGARAEAISKDLAKNAIDPEIRRWSEDRLVAGQLSREGVIESWNLDRGIHPDKIDAIGDCYSVTPDGKKRVWFGYSNRTGAAKDIPIGEDNKFTPAPHDRGQPTHFEAQYRDYVFSIVLEQQVLTWHLYKTKLTVKVDELKPCPEHELEAYGIR